MAPGEALMGRTTDDLTRIPDDMEQIEIRNVGWPHWIKYKGRDYEFFVDPTYRDGRDERIHPYWRVHFDQSALELSHAGVVVYQDNSLNRAKRRTDIPFAQFVTIQTRKGRLGASGHLRFVMAGQREKESQPGVFFSWRDNGYAEKVRDKVLAAHAEWQDERRR